MSKENTQLEKITATEITEGESGFNEVVTEFPEMEPVYIPVREKKRVHLTHRTWTKVITFLLTILMAAVTVFAVVFAVFMVEEDIYWTPKSEYQMEAFYGLAEGVAQDVLQLVADGREEAAEDYLRSKLITGITIKSADDRDLRWEYYNSETLFKTGTVGYDSKWLWYPDGSIRSERLMNSATHMASLVYVCVEVPVPLYELENFAINAMYALRYWIYAIIAASLLLTVLCFVFLMRASGRRKGYDAPQPGWGTKIPFDMLTVALGLALFLILQVAVESSWLLSDIPQLIVWTVCGLVAMVLSLGWCMSAAVRVKLGKWCENTVIFRVAAIAFRFLKKFLCAAWRILKKCGRMVLPILSTVPLVWKTAAVCMVVLMADAFLVAVFRRDTDMLIFTWILLHGAVFAGVLYIAVILRRLQKGGEVLAAGDFSYQVDTKWMLPDFKAHAENLSRVGEGMTVAVEQRLTSERLKTELITNVSHDIKTPLTSIINYSDLIEKEPCDNEKIIEYASVLYRQSERLKRLIEDLVEASKASTGNLDVQLAPCEVGVMLSQTVGEYEQRLEQCKLALVTKQPEQPVRIMADGRRLWRVFDNLMNNICKYAMPGTRVYLTLEEADGQAVISFKNTSREPLDLSADELMERFVRGDVARNSEGNGLGLSIAKSLVQLQNGTLELTVDGDLFKVVLRFPIMK